VQRTPGYLVGPGGVVWALDGGWIYWRADDGRDHTTLADSCKVVRT
jgi:hypothetical protein